jgi:hypothetical protein
MTHGIGPADASPDLIGRMAEFITQYRANKLDPSAMMMAAGRAFPGSTMSHYAVALTQANKASIGAAQ